MRSKTSTKKSRPLKLESLEKRELMAADVTAGLSQGTLFINGSTGNDQVRIAISKGITTVLSNNRPVFSTPLTYSAIDAKMGDGSDKLEINTPQLNNLQSVRVDLGHGSSERLLLKVGYVRSIHVDANRSIATGMTIEANADRVFADFGNDGGRDVMGLGHSSVNRLETNMGSGNDTIALTRTSVRDARLNFGSGQDSLFVDDKSAITSGLIDGGSDSDEIRGRNRIGSRVSVRSFERVR